MKQVRKQTVKYKDVAIGQLFECWGDIHQNYEVPKICKCIKKDANTAEEINGIIFTMNDNDEVTLG